MIGPPPTGDPRCVCGHERKYHRPIMGAGHTSCTLNDCTCWRYAVPTRPEIKFGVRPAWDEPYNEKEKFLIDVIWNGNGDRLAKDILAEADLKYPNMKTRFEP